MTGKKSSAELIAEAQPNIDAIVTALATIDVHDAHRGFLSAYDSFIREGEPEVAMILTKKYMMSIQGLSIDASLVSEGVGRKQPLVTLLRGKPNLESVHLFADATKLYANKILEEGTGIDELNASILARETAINFYALSAALNVTNRKRSISPIMAEAESKRQQKIIREIGEITEALTRLATHPSVDDVYVGLIHLDQLLTKRQHLSGYTTQFIVRQLGLIRSGSDLSSRPEQWESVKPKLDAIADASLLWNAAYEENLYFPKEMHDLLLRMQVDTFKRQEQLDTLKEKLDAMNATLKTLQSRDDASANVLRVKWEYERRHLEEELDGMIREQQSPYFNTSRLQLLTQLPERKVQTMFQDAGDIFLTAREATNDLRLRVFRHLIEGLHQQYLGNVSSAEKAYRALLDIPELERIPNPLYPLVHFTQVHDCAARNTKNTVVEYVKEHGKVPDYSLLLKISTTRSTPSASST